MALVYFSDVQHLRCAASQMQNHRLSLSRNRNLAWSSGQTFRSIEVRDLKGSPCAACMHVCACVRACLCGCVCISVGLPFQYFNHMNHSEKSTSVYPNRFSHTTVSYRPGEHNHRHCLSCYPFPMGINYFNSIHFSQYLYSSRLRLMPTRTTRAAPTAVLSTACLVWWTWAECTAEGLQSCQLTMAMKALGHGLLQPHFAVRQQKAS